MLFMNFEYYVSCNMIGCREVSLFLYANEDGYNSFDLNIALKNIIDPHIGAFLK